MIGGRRSRDSGRARLLQLAGGDDLGVDAHALGGVVRFVDADQPVGDLEHVVPERDDDELGVLRLLLGGRPQVINTPCTKDHQSA